jgi:hypothetical protein
MRFYRHYTVLTYFIIIAVTQVQSQSQLNKIKAGILGVPGFQSGFATGNIGYEQLNKDYTGSWQIHYNFSTGSVAADAGSTKRNWITVEKTFYIQKPVKYVFLYSFFAEAGNRTKLAGFVHSPPDSIFKNTTSSEVCPGIAIGFHRDLGKHWGIQAVCGPKMIIDIKKESLYYSISSLSYFTVPEEKNIRAGMRFMLNICYQF